MRPNDIKLSRKLWKPVYRFEVYSQWSLNAEQKLWSYLISWSLNRFICPSYKWASGPHGGKIFPNCREKNVTKAMALRLCITCSYNQTIHPTFLSTWEGNLMDLRGCSTSQGSRGWGLGGGPDPEGCQEAIWGPSKPARAIKRMMDILAS